MEEASYNCEAATVAGFIQQLAVGLIARGYWFYVTGIVPMHKNPRAIDAKLIDRYGITPSKWARARAKRRGAANVQYLRFRHFFVLLATRGRHVLFEQEPLVADVRRKPIHCFGYTVGCYQAGGKWHASVRIERALFKELAERFLAAAVHESAEVLGEQFAALNFEAYAPVRTQILNLLVKVNRARDAAGMERVDLCAPVFKRRPVRPFVQ